METPREICTIIVSLCVSDLIRVLVPVSVPSLVPIPSAHSEGMDMYHRVPPSPLVFIPLLGKPYLVKPLFDCVGTSIRFNDPIPH